MKTHIQGEWEWIHGLIWVEGDLSIQLERGIDEELRWWMHNGAPKKKGVMAMAKCMDSY